MNKKIVLSSLAFGIFIGIALMLIQQYRAANLAAYADAHNCEWRHTGAMYGDDRDFICE